jgi:hypothetical protein
MRARPPLSRCPVGEDRMNVQHAASLYLPNARHQEHRLPAKPFHRVLIRPPVETSPPTGSLTVPSSSRRLLHATPKLARVLVLPQACADPLIPRKTIRARSRDGTQQDVPGQDLQVAEQLLALIACPHMAVLRTAPTAAHLPAPVQRATTAAAAPNNRTKDRRPSSVAPTPIAPRLSGARMFASG